MERVEGSHGCLSVSVFWFGGERAVGTTSDTQTRSGALGGMRGMALRGKIPAGEMCHDDRMMVRIGNSGMAPMGALSGTPCRGVCGGL